ncbi:hypothetical protein ABZY68_25590 [Streptomyces sp. NPDC006482]|uniref:hypothetical protein n=1 Tax=Streptomyces sp. NPDC006482 TaxID=3154306 RepID=UPI0033B248B1
MTAQGVNTVALRLPDGPGPVDLDAHAFTVLGDALLAGDRWNADQLGTVLGWAGRITGPYLLWEAHDGGLVDQTALAAHIGMVWSRTEFPDAALGHDRWRELWHAAGFTRDGHPAAQPAAPMELWRGSVPERRTDWSWTTDRTVAEEYAAGGFRRKAGRLYRTFAPAGALLGAYNGRGEGEYVIDTRGLAIIEHEGEGRG